MKILLRQKSTGLYYQSPGQWVGCNKAYVFISSVEALNSCARNHLSDVCMVFKFDDCGYEIQLPVPDSKTGGPKAPALSHVQTEAF